MSKILRDMFTGPDGKSFEMAHFVWFLGAIVLMGIALYTAVKTGAYPQNFGQDFGIVNGGGALGSWGRAKADQAART